jgi:hypothetical protein
MKKDIRVALFGHDSCRTRFFTELDDKSESHYRGKCPNPKCNRHVVLFPETLFTSTDKARREYIKESQSRQDLVFWKS